MRNRILLASIASAFLACSCIHSKVQQLPSYHLASSMGDAADEETTGTAKVFYVEQIDTSSLPTAVPYAVVGMNSGERVGRDALAEAAKKKLADTKPDFILVGQSSAYQTGATHHYLGYGVGFSQATYGVAGTAVAYRCAPVLMGLRLNEQRMVVLISDSSSRTSGIQEGDTLLSFAGTLVNDELTSPHYVKLLQLRPGDDAELVWIRPGVGRMSGSFRLSANSPTHLSIADSLETSRALNPPKAEFY